MREIKEIAAFIIDEVDGCLEYAKAAVFYKNSRPDLANLYYNLATVELTHVQKLHVEAEKLVAEAESKNKEYPASMRDSWDKKHKKALEKANKANVYLGMFK